MSADIHQIFVRITYSPGSVLPWRRCGTLCTSGLMDVPAFIVTYEKRRAPKVTQRAAAPGAEAAV